MIDRVTLQMETYGTAAKHGILSSIAHGVRNERCMNYCENGKNIIISFMLNAAVNNESVRSITRVSHVITSSKALPNLHLSKVIPSSAT
ncbi:5861_t:CDS:2 [Funneliformis mosseae]|uniref:5861_t:CDS:1 n=1 Tax=Funneliformis mosseae TaxID=27381 RepID=A0A9N9EZL5_FUNMO|nr:5861_t:CDS:2 [Funneliformis mosseae]